MNNPSVAVVILNWNGREKGLIDTYLPTVLQYSLDRAEVYVADNGSKDDSVPYIRENFPQVKLIVLDNNYGFTGGYNRALKKIEADYYVLLNDDVRVSSNWIAPIVDKMEKDLRVAAAQPKLLSDRDEEFFEYAGAAGGYLDFLGYPFCAGRIMEEIERDEGQFDKERPVFWASGAALFVRASVWHNLGGLDEDFFAHMEEIDFCWRAKNRGFKIMYYPQSKVFHYGAATLQSNNPRKTYLNFRNNLLLLYKNLPENRLEKVLYIRRFMDFLAALVFLLQGKAGDMKAVFKAWKDFKAKRKDFQVKRMASIETYPDCVLRCSLVFSFKILRRRKFSKLQNHIV